MSKDRVGTDRAGDAEPASGQLLEDHGVGGVIQAQAAILLGNSDPEQAHLSHLIHQCRWIRVIAIVLCRYGPHVSFHELSDHGEDLFSSFFNIRGQFSRRFRLVEIWPDNNFLSARVIQAVVRVIW